MEEEWRPVPGREGLYEVSNLGKVRSLPRTVTYISRWGTEAQRFVAGGALKVSVDKRGYAMTCLCAGGITTSCAIHVLVLTAFVGPCPVGLECRHLDGDPSNNRLDNLAWGTHIENCSDRVNHGTVARGERHGIAKLTPGEIVKIRAAIAAGRSMRDVAKEFAVSPTAILRIVHGRTWSHV